MQLIDETDREIGRWILPKHDPVVLTWVDWIPQETLFWRRDAWRKIGAGLDTFAYRNPYPPDALRVFEVDAPATQAWKRDLLSRTKIAEPASLTA